MKFSIEIDNDERGVIGDFTTISDIRIMKAKPDDERGVIGDFTTISDIRIMKAKPE